MVRVRPRMLGLPDEGPAAAKGIAVKFFDGFYDVRPDGIQVYVANQSKEVIVFVAEDGFIAVLEQMSGALMAAVVDRFLADDARYGYLSSSAFTE